MSCIECFISCCPGGEQCRSFHSCPLYSSDSHHCMVSVQVLYLYIFIIISGIVLRARAIEFPYLNLAAELLYSRLYLLRFYLFFFPSRSSCVCARPFFLWPRNKNEIHVLHIYIHIIIHYIISKSYFYSKQTALRFAIYTVSVVSLAERCHILRVRVFQKYISGTWVPGGELPLGVGMTVRRRTHSRLVLFLNI